MRPWSPWAASSKLSPRALGLLSLDALSRALYFPVLAEMQAHMIMLIQVTLNQGAALAISVIPTALSVVAPDTIRGSIGVLHQLSICIGIVRNVPLSLIRNRFLIVCFQF